MLLFVTRITFLKIVMERFKDRRLEELALGIKAEDESVPSTSSASGLRNIANTEGRIRKTKNRATVDAVNTAAGPSEDGGNAANNPERSKKLKKNNKS